MDNPVKVGGSHMLKEFKDFVMRGNVLDLAVAVIIGGAFGAIVTSLINDVLMPPIGLALGHVDFKDLFASLNGQSYASLTAAKAAGAPVIAYGQFINTITNFLVIAFVVFMVVKQANRFKKPAAAPATKECPYCASNIPLKAVRCPQCTSDLAQAPA
jgi:large conductance mechanosensitive channel